jgi:uncharacterized membrane protein
MIFLTVLGIADASYLTYEKFSGYIPPCGEGFDCGAVLSSPYAQIGPIPLSLLGVGYYLTALILVAGSLLEIPQLNKSWLLLLLTSTGFAFSIALVGLMAFVIESWCLYCLVSAGTSTALFFLSLALQYLHTKKIHFGS